jgi:hypothetical protein
MKSGNADLNFLSIKSSHTRGVRTEATNLVKLYESEGEQSEFSR